MKRSRMTLSVLATMLVVVGLSVHFLHLDTLAWQNWKLNRQPVPANAFGLGRYQVDIEAQRIAGLDEGLSALTYNSDSNTLLGVTNNEPLVVELSLEGKLLRTIRIEGVSDTEGFTYIGNNRYVIAEERKQRLLEIEILPGVEVIDTSTAPSLTIAVDKAHNKGLEGLSWDHQTQQLLVVKERDPMRVLTIDGFIGGIASPPNIRINYKPELTAARLFMADLSSLTIDQLSGNLLLLSDQSHMVVEYAENGKPLSLLGLWRGMSGLSRTVPQAEGLAVDNQRRVYIVSEPNLFYRFVPVTPELSDATEPLQQPERRANQRSVVD